MCVHMSTHMPRQSCHRNKLETVWGCKMPWARRESSCSSEEGLIFTCATCPPHPPPAGFSAHCLSFGCAGPLVWVFGLFLALSQRQTRSLWLWDSALFSSFCSEESFILALFSGHWGLGETRGDLAIGQLTNLSWAVWRGPGPASLRLISSHCLPPFWTAFVLLQALQHNLVCLWDSTATLGGSHRLSGPIKYSRGYWHRCCERRPNLWCLFSVVINSHSHCLASLG